MKMIYKHVLNLIGGTELELPPGTKVLTAGVDPNGDIAVWVEESVALKTKVKFNLVVCMTGQRVPDNMTHVATFPYDQKGRTLMVHVYWGQE